MYVVCVEGRTARLSALAYLRNDDDGESVKEGWW
jgi:hypothetical protein